MGLGSAGGLSTQEVEFRSVYFMTEQIYFCLRFQRAFMGSTTPLIFF